MTVKKTLVLVFALSLLCASQNAMAESAQEFTLQSMNNVNFDLGSFKNSKPVLLMFWTTWCPYCRQGLKEINKVYSQLSGEGLKVVLINIGEQQAKVSNFLKANGYSFDVYLDKDSRVAKMYGLVGIPTYILVDKKGEIRFSDNYFPGKEYKPLLSE